MILIQYLHQLGKECDLEAVISISAAWDPFKTVDSLEKKWHNRLLYSKHVAKNLRKMFIRFVSNTGWQGDKKNFFFYSVILI